MRTLQFRAWDITKLPRVPGPVVRGLTARRTIHFPSEFQAIAVDVRIRNLDATNPLTYMVNSVADTELNTLGAGGFDTISDSLIETLHIRPHPTTGNWEVQANLVSLEVLRRLGVWG